MADEKNRDLQRLTKDEVKTALLGMIVVSTDANNGKGRNLTFAQLAAKAQDENAISMSSERVLLKHYTGQNAANRASTFNTDNASDVVDNELDIRTGTTRHSFDDGYYAIEIHYYHQLTQNNSRQITLIPIESFNETDFEDREPIGYSISGPRNGIFRTGVSAFGLHGTSQTSEHYIRSIYGLRLNIG